MDRPTRRVPRSTRSLFVASALSIGIAACKEEVTELPADAGADGGLELSIFARPQVTPLAFGPPVDLALSNSALNFLFSFTLSAPAQVSLSTQAAANGADVDTVLTLSRIDQHGLPRAVGSSDDFDHTVFSELDRELSAGSYRVSLRGATLRTRGAFVFFGQCTGTGCPVDAPVCLFGSQFSDLRTNALLTVVSEVWITNVNQIDGALMRDQVVLAVQQSAHTDVSTPEQALAAVDQNEIRQMEVSEVNGSRSFTVFEYGAGDNSYGAIFDQGTLTIAASIHDGDLAGCDVSP